MNIQRIVLLIMLVCVPSVSWGFAAEPPRIQSNIQTSTNTQLTKEEQRAVSLAGGRILKHVNQARTALSSNHQEQAIENIDKALKLVDIIHSVSPTYLVRARIQAGDLVYEDEESIRPFLVTIYDELDRVSVLAPIIESKEKNAQRSQGGIPPVISDASLQYGRFFFDLEYTRQHLNSAREALVKNKDARLADAALLTIQLSVAFEYSVVDMPLSKASQNLMLARTMYEQNRLEEARAAVQETLDALAIYEKAVGEEKAKEVRQLRQDMSVFLNQMEPGKPQVIDRMMQWWDQLSVWF